MLKFLRTGSAVEGQSEGSNSAAGVHVILALAAILRLVLLVALVRMRARDVHERLVVAELLRVIGRAVCKRVAKESP